jgi:superfamily II DNA helicase RecQ
MIVQDLLQSVFGHKEFRNFQQEAVESILNSKDLMMI